MKINWPTGFTILAILCVTLVGNNFASAQSTGSGINWGELCRNPAVDPMIAEPCESLTSPDGYQLTPEGNRVLYCILAGGVGKFVGLSEDDLKQFAPAAGCGPQPSTSILPSSQNPVIDQNISAGTNMDNATISGNMTLASDIGTNMGPVSTGNHLTILQGSSVEGNRYYEPDTLAVRHGDEINVVNADTEPHTVTSGTGPQDSNSAKSFDTSIIEASESFVVSTSNLASGYYPYYCSIHPYMEGILRID